MLAQLAVGIASRLVTVALPGEHLVLVEPEPAAVDERGFGVAVVRALAVPALGGRLGDPEQRGHRGAVEQRAAIVDALLGVGHAF